MWCARRHGAAACGRRASPRSAPSGLPAALPSVARRLLLGDCGAHLRLLVCAGKSRDFKSNIRRLCALLGKPKARGGKHVVSEGSDHGCVWSFVCVVPCWLAPWQATNQMDLAG